MEEADLLAQRGSYGHATALLIHGIEALAQAWTCFAFARGSMKFDESHVKDYFKLHDIKLDFFVANLLMLETGKEFYLKHFRKEDMWNLNILPMLNYYESIKDMINEKREKYPKELMKKRNRGIYVDFDYQNSKFLAPQDIDEADYLKIKNESDMFWTVIVTLINNPLIKYE